MSDFNYRGKLPFRIISSSVNTGYNAELTAAVGYNIEIVDQHRDEYGGLQDSPAQGPFTEQWVGGNQHRHVDLNAGSDEPNKRPEAFIVSGSSGKVRIYGPTHFDINAPKALLTRDNVAKSPVNIKNIRDEDRRLGNFSKNYQVVQSVGRRISNNLINDNFIASGSLTTQFIYSNETKLPATAIKQVTGVSGYIIYFTAKVINSDGISDSGYGIKLNLLYGQPTTNIVESGKNITINSSKTGVGIGQFESVSQLVSIINTSGNWVSGVPKIGATFSGSSITAVSSFSDIQFTGGTLFFDYSLPDITNNSKSIFVERFNAPGGKEVSSRGALDREGEEYAPNNSLTTRNIKVRQPYYNQLTQHAAQFNSGSSEGVTVHAINRNTIQTIEEQNGTFVTASDHDNFWVQHAIPSTDLRYKWIADSVVSSQEPIQYQKLYDSTELVFNSASLVTSGSNGQFQVDNVGINSIVKNKKSIDTSTNTFAITTPNVSASYTEIANTPYGFSSWKEIRGGEHPVAKALRNNNIISVQTPERPIVNGSLTTRKRSNSVTNFTEPPVTNKHKPLTQALKLKGGDKTYYFISTYNNNLSTVVNTQLKDILGLNEDSTQIGDMLGTYYRAVNRGSDINNPVEKLENLIYSETLYPREINTYLAETRGRLYFSVTSSTNNYADRDNINIQLGTHRTYWKDSVVDRQRNTTSTTNDFYNSMNYEIIRKGTTYNSVQSATCSVFNLPRYVYTLPTLNYTSSYTFKNIRVGRSIRGIDINSNYTSQQIADVGITASWTTSTSNNVVYGIKSLDNGLSGELNYENFLDYFYSSSNSPVKVQLTRVTDYSTLTQFDDRVGFVTGTFETYGNYNPGGDVYFNLTIPRPNYTAFLGGFESGSRNYQIVSNAWNDLSKYEFFNNKPTGPILSTLDSGLRYASESFGDKKPWFDSYENYSDDIRSYAKDHSILPEFRVSSHIPYYVTEEGGNFRAKNKSFLEIDGIGENYRSSDGEVRNLYNSDFINSYVTTDISEGYDIQKDNSNLKLQNINFTVSGIKKLLPYNGFYPQERTIQLANLFNNFLDNNIAGGYFKLLQVVNYSALDSLYGEMLIDITQSSDYFYKNAILPYFFAPGILYNTIKSGISVDFPAIIATSSNIFNEPAGAINDDFYYYNSSIASGRANQLDVIASRMKKGFINTRLPFESIILPEKYIPINSKLTGSIYRSFAGTQNDANIEKQFFDNLISGTILCGIKFDVNSNPDIFPAFNGYVGLGFKDATPFAFLKNNEINNPSYSMAMSNFLAEIPRFFLKNGTMNVFRSAEAKDWKTFEIGKKYYFDLKMRKSSDLVMIEAYSSSYHVTGNTNLEKSFNGRYFGWPVSKTPYVESAYDDLVRHNDPAYTPFTPPYFEGEAILRFELSASKTSYNSVTELQDDISVVNIFNSLGQVINENSEAYIHKMSIQDCMEIFGIGQNPIASFNNANSPDNFEQAPNTSKQYWAISPKLETPVLDFSDQQFMEHTGSYWVSSGYGRGMWSGYGKIPTGSKGITIEIAESFPLQTGFRTNLVIDNLKTGSLLQQVGFQAETAKIGQLAESKTISEAIVMIPYVDNSIQGVTTYIDGHHFFSINEDIFNTLNNNVERGVPSVIPGEQIGYESSVTKMIKQMKNYVIPPRFNFLNYDNVKPFVMYLFEFTHDLDQQDLADIWQGVMPKIATTAEHDTLQFGHKTGQFELFGADFVPPENMRWMVFKVKKKAEWNYFAITENIGDDQNFKFKFANSQEAKTPDYSYNWPYDYFSLVELAKVDVTYDYQEVSGSSQFQQAVIINTGG